MQLENVNVKNRKKFDQSAIDVLSKVNKKNTSHRTVKQNYAYGGGRPFGMEFDCVH